MALQVTVVNHGGSPFSVSTVAMGTLHVISLTRDGRPVSPRPSTVQTIVPLGTLIHSKLSPLGAGGTVVIDWESGFNQGVGGQALESVRVQPDQNADDLYSFAAPGHYVLSIDYSYSPAANAEPSTLQGPTNKTAVSFDVVP